jgi:hypothetical protein
MQASTQTVPSTCYYQIEFETLLHSRRMSNFYEQEYFRWRFLLRSSPLFTALEIDMQQRITPNHYSDPK